MTSSVTAFDTTIDEQTEIRTSNHVSTKRRLVFKHKLRRKLSNWFWWLSTTFLILNPIMIVAIIILTIGTYQIVVSDPWGDYWADVEQYERSK